jgi:dolichol-phosphate mannosyltransferase
MVLVVIPTYNEKDNLPDLVRAVLAHEGTRVMVVDDQSPDGTGKLADALAVEFPGRVEVMHRTGQRGLGRSYVDGLRRALQSDATLICQMDGDWSHDPQYLPAMIAACNNNDRSRRLMGMESLAVWKWGAILVVSVIVAALVLVIARFVRGTARAAIAAGAVRRWRSFRSTRSSPTATPSGRDAFEAHRRGAQIGEVPIIFVERRLGVSKLSGSVLLESCLTPWRLRLRSLGRSPS